MRQALHVLLCGLLLLCAPAFSQNRSLFTGEELAWIEAHPVLRVGVDPAWVPLAYLENGTVKGLAAEYLAAITRVSGLRFSVRPDIHWSSARHALIDGQVDLLPAAYGQLGDSRLAEQIAFSAPYFASSTLVVTRADAAVIYDLRQLLNKVVAVKRGAAYDAELREEYPGIQVIGTASPDEALEEVANGHAYAAIDIDAAVIPILHRRYFDELHVAGVLTQMPASLSMAVRADDRVLLSIIDKSLASLSAQETDRMLARWLESSDYGLPSWSLMLHHYRLEFAAGVAVVLFLAFLSYRVVLARRRAERSERDKSMFLAVMSHEIRTPMHAILASVELLAQGRLPPAEARLANVAVASSVTLLQLLDDVLDFSKMEADKLELECAPVNIRALLQEVVDIAQARAADKRLLLYVRLPAEREVWPVLDAHRVRQVLNNLLANAIKFTEQGYVELAATLDAAPGQPERGTLLITVSDTGIGIPRRQQARLFKAFTQADRSTTRRFGGTGLGLSICRDLVNLMQGHITVDSEPGRGTVMHVELPVALAAAPSGLSTAEPGIEPASVSGLKVLVVEDHPVNQFVIERQLATLGHAVTQASTGEAGLELLNDEVFDLVLLDCNLPDMDGYTVATRLRERERVNGRHTPVIAISAMVGADHAQTCLAAGMDGLLSKPLRIQELKEMIELWCAGEPDQRAAKTATTISEVMAGQLGLFQQTSRDDLQGIRAAHADGDWRAVSSLAHRIAGAALMLDLAAVAGAARRIEEHAGGPCGAVAVGPLAVLVDELDAELQRLQGERLV